MKKHKRFIRIILIAISILLALMSYIADSHACFVFLSAYLTGYLMGLVTEQEY